MLKFTEYLLNEKLITFENKRPDYNTIVIMAGGAGSGKGFVLKKLLGVSGKVIDTDRLKDFIVKSQAIKSKLKSIGRDLETIDFKNPDDVSLLHNIVDQLGIKDKVISTILSSATQSTNKPNIIFDITLKSKSSLIDIIKSVTAVGYKPENIHIVWVLTNKEDALQNNAQRDRVVDPEIVSAIHDDVATSIKNIMSDSKFQNLGTFTIVLNGGDQKIKADKGVVKQVNKLQGKIKDGLTPKMLDLIRTQIPSF